MMKVGGLGSWEPSSKSSSRVLQNETNMEPGQSLKINPGELQYEAHMSLKCLPKGALGFSDAFWSIYAIWRSEVSINDRFYNVFCIVHPQCAFYL